MEGCKCKPAKSFAEQIIEYKDFIALVKRMREAEDAANRALVESDDYSEALIYINKAEEIEREVDEYLKKMEI